MAIQIISSHQMDNKRITAQNQYSKDKIGKVIGVKGEVMGQWAEHFTELLNIKRKDWNERSM